MEDLRAALAERLGWKPATQVFNKTQADSLWRKGGELYFKLPSLSELVKAGEERLTDAVQQRSYVLALMNHTLPVRYAFTVCTPIQMFKVVTASTEVRAQALLETLPK